MHQLLFVCLRAKHYGFFLTVAFAARIKVSFRFSFYSYRLKSNVSTNFLYSTDDERTIDDGKYDGSTQICGIPKLEHEDLTDIEQNRDSLLCYMVFLKRGCYENAAKSLGGKVLIDESYKSNKANYSDFLKE